jgi:hypothetical protein
MESIHAVFLLVLVIAAPIAPLFNRKQAGHRHEHHYEPDQTVSRERKRKQTQ